MFVEIAHLQYHFLPFCSVLTAEAVEENNKAKVQKKKDKKEIQIKKTKYQKRTFLFFILLCPHLVDSTIRISISCTVCRKHLLKALELVVWRQNMWVKMSHGE